MLARYSIPVAIVSTDTIIDEEEDGITLFTSNIR